MKKFMLQVVLPFVIIISIFFGIGEYYLRSLPNDFKSKNAYLEQNSKNLKILVLGASSMSMGIKPCYFSYQPAYNCAYASQSLDYDYWILSKFINQMDSLKWVVMDMHCIRPWYPKNSGVDAKDRLYYLYYGCPYYLDNGFDVRFEMSAGFSELKHLVFPSNRKEAIMTTDTDGYQSGYYDIVPFEEEKWKHSAEWSVEHLSILHNPDSPEKYANGVDYICKMIELCKKRGVRVAMVSTPTMAMFYDNFDKEQLKVLHNLADSLTDMYDNAYYFDYLKADSLFSVDEMYNPTHLNPKGAKKFTLILNDSIIKIDSKYKQ